MVVQHNLTAMNSNRMLGVTTKSQAKSTEKLSSGYKINRAADDAAGLSISEKMRKQIRGLTQASANAQDGISAVQTAEGALNEVQDMLQRMNELAVKASNGTMSENDRSYVQNEIDQLVTEIDRVAETTKFNETYLLKGSGNKSSNIKAEATIGTTTQKAEVVAAKGNIYSGVIDDTAATTLAAGTEDTAVISYKDAEGNTRTKDVTFKVGADAKATAANIANAINDDAELSKIFIASSDKDGKLSVESKLDGSKTDNTKNNVNSISFNSSGGARKTSFETGTVKTADATQASYEIKIASGKNTAVLAAGEFSDGSSITIEGKTYTFDAGKASTDTNSFKSLQDLQDLLGSDYKVEMTMTATATNGANKAKLEQTIDATGGGTTAINALSATQFTSIDADKPSAGYTLDAGSVSASLKITKLADPSDKEEALKLSLHVGADSTEENKISVEIDSMSARGLGIDGLRVDGKTSVNADNAIDTIASALQKVSTQRSALGAVQNRLEHTIANLDNVVENTTSAESAIRDTDMATEMVKFSNNNILAQAGQSMLAQANQSNQGVLSLLG